MWPHCSAHYSANTSPHCSAHCGVQLHIVALTDTQRRAGAQQRTAKCICGYMRCAALRERVSTRRARREDTSSWRGALRREQRCSGCSAARKAAGAALRAAHCAWTIARGAQRWVLQGAAQSARRRSSGSGHGAQCYASLRFAAQRCAARTRTGRQRVAQHGVLKSGARAATGRAAVRVARSTAQGAASAYSGEACTAARRHTLALHAGKSIRVQSRSLITFETT
jgi:hypothetical protein